MTERRCLVLFLAASAGQGAGFVFFLTALLGSVDESMALMLAAAGGLLAFVAPFQLTRLMRRGPIGERHP